MPGALSLFGEQHVSAAQEPQPQAPPGDPPAGPPPWIDETIQQRIAWRDGDIVVSVPPKSGTTWTMNIVHQLRSAGDPAFADVYLEVPWLEFVPAPGTGIDDLVEAKNAALAARLREEMQQAVDDIDAIPAPFDTAILGDDDAEGRMQVLAAIRSLQTFADSLEEAAGVLGIPLELE